MNTSGAENWSSSSPVRAFSHIAIAVADLETARRFYTEALGFTPSSTYRSAGRGVAQLMEASPDGFAGVFLRLGDVLLELLEHAHGFAREPVPRPAAAYGFAHISFVVEDIDLHIEGIKAAGGELRTRRSYHFAGSTETTIAFCTDPDGNRIELIEHSDPAEIGAHAAYLGLDIVGWPGADEVERTRRVRAE